MTVADVMTKDLIAVAPDTSLETAARLFAQYHITGAPVVAESGEALGVVSLADLVDPDRESGGGTGHAVYYRITDGWAAVIGDVSAAKDGRVDEVMTRDLIAATPTDTIETAAQLMLDAGIHRLLVNDGDELVGIVSTTDLLRGFVKQARADSAN